MYHNAAITNDGELYTWGSNVNGCLGRKIDEAHSSSSSSFTPHPGHCTCFGVIVDRIGRGLPRSIACGKEFTLVATYPYLGPDENTAKQLMQDKKRNDHEKREYAAKREKILHHHTKQESKSQRKLLEIEHLTSKRLCILDPNCPGKSVIHMILFHIILLQLYSIFDPYFSFVHSLNSKHILIFTFTGFQVHALKPSICRECGHSSIYHTITESEHLNNSSDAGDILNKGILS